MIPSVYACRRTPAIIPTRANVENEAIAKPPAMVYSRPVMLPHRDTARTDVSGSALDDRRLPILSGGRRVAYTDRTLTCADCGAPFTFSADDQAYHAQKGFTNEPRRCPDCRTRRRSERGESSYGGGGGYGGGQREMYSATRASCGRSEE